MPSSAEPPIMELIDIRKQYGSSVLRRKHTVRAVDGVSLAIKPGGNAGACRRKRLRQIDGWSDRRQTAGAKRRQSAF
ncbi:hypothetical protein [Paenibacillus gorillae]|uniref:hypothetical protein n=1 Tax=Paenibacillus gorillae TaxID=1243662 RepID=UPI0004B9DFA4|nr:hypothetical protein [Paenibacillus gorillae]